MASTLRTRGACLLRTWRLRSRLTQHQAAVKLDLSEPPYNKFETGKKKPGRMWSVRIAEGTDGSVPVEAWDQKPSRDDLRAMAAAERAMAEARRAETEAA